MILGRILSSSVTSLAAMNFDAGMWSRSYPAQHLAGHAKPTPGGTAVDIPEMLRALPDALGRRTRLESHLREQIGAVLRLAPERVRIDQPLKTLGVDSLMAVELRNRLERSLGLRLPVSLVWSYPTIAIMAPHLAAKLEIDIEPAQFRHPPAVDPDQTPGELSQDNLGAVLSAEIAAVEKFLTRQ